MIYLIFNLLSQHKSISKVKFNVKYFFKVDMPRFNWGLTVEAGKLWLETTDFKSIISSIE